MSFVYNNIIYLVVVVVVSVDYVEKLKFWLYIGKITC